MYYPLLSLLCTQGARRSETLRLLEGMALDVVQQLASALPTVDDPKGRQCPNEKIYLRLADRKRPVKEDGYIIYMMHTPAR